MSLYGVLSLRRALGDDAAKKLILLRSRANKQASKRHVASELQHFISSLLSHHRLMVAGPLRLERRLECRQNRRTTLHSFLWR